MTQKSHQNPGLRCIDNSQVDYFATDRSLFGFAPMEMFVVEQEKQKTEHSVTESGAVARFSLWGWAIRVFCVVLRARGAPSAAGAVACRAEKLVQTLKTGACAGKGANPRTR